MKLLGFPKWYCDCLPMLSASLRQSITDRPNRAVEVTLHPETARELVGVLRAHDSGRLCAREMGVRLDVTLEELRAERKARARECQALHDKVTHYRQLALLLGLAAAIACGVIALIWWQ